MVRQEHDHTATKKSDTAAPSKPKTTPRAAGSKKERSITKSDVERLEKVLRLAEEYAAEKKETLSAALYGSYSDWSTQRKEITISHSLFTRQMVQLGYTKRKSNGKPLLQGVRLRAGQIAEVAAQPVGTA